jgi:hypothetical protein
MDARLKLSGMTAVANGCPLQSVGHDPIFCHPRMWLAGIHPEMPKMNARYKLSDMIVRSM